MTEAAHVFERDGRVVVPKGWLPWVSVLLPIAYFAFAWSLAGHQVGQAMQFIVWGLSLRQSSLKKNWKGSERKGKVRVDAEGVWLRGRLLVRRAAIADAVWTPKGSEGFVRVLDKKRNVLVDIDVTDESEALALLGILGIDPSRRRARFAAVSPVLATTRNLLVGLVPALLVLVVGAALALAGYGFPNGTFAWAIGLFWLPFLVGYALPTDVEVGADGVLVRSPFGRRYMAFADVLAVALDKDTIQVVLREGKAQIKVGGGWGQKADDAHEDGAALLARIEAGMKAYRERTDVAPLASFLARSGRAHDEWLGELEKLREGTSTYRSGAIREDDLWRVVDDAAAPPDARAAAAFLLRQDAPRESTRLRLRVASEGTASPELRVALEAAADGDEASLAAAVADVARE